VVTNSSWTNLLSSPLPSSFICLHPDLTRPPTRVDPDLTISRIIITRQRWTFILRRSILRKLNNMSRSRGKLATSRERLKVSGRRERSLSTG